MSTFGIQVESLSAAISSTQPILTIRENPVSSKITCRNYLDAPVEQKVY